MQRAFFGQGEQWHTETRTGKSAVLRRLAGERGCYVEISPLDAGELGIRTNQKVRVGSRRATIEARAFITHAVKAGEIFIAMPDATVNRLTFPAFDPHSHQASCKACAVRVSPA